MALEPLTVFTICQMTIESLPLLFTVWFLNWRWGFFSTLLLTHLHSCYMSELSPKCDLNGKTLYKNERENNSDREGHAKTAVRARVCDRKYPRILLWAASWRVIGCWGVGGGLHQGSTAVRKQELTANAARIASRTKTLYLVINLFSLPFPFCYYTRNALSDARSIGRSDTRIFFLPRPIFLPSWPQDPRLMTCN